MVFRRVGRYGFVMQRLGLALWFVALLAGCADDTSLPGDASRDVRRADAVGLDGTGPDDGVPRGDGAMDATGDTGGLADTGGELNCIPTGCEATERCFDGLDNNCNGVADEACPCIPGTSTRCLTGRADPTVSICGWGEMQCVGAGEFGTWGPCTGVGSRSDGGSSPYGCRRIGIMGAPGANPSSNFQRWLNMQGAIATRFHTTAAAPTLQRAQLETFDLVIVDWLQRDYALAESMTLRDWVRNGGALMVMTGHDSGATAHRHNSLIVALNVSYRLSPPLDGPAILLMHPTTATADGRSTLPPVTFVGGLEVIVPADVDGLFMPIARIGTITVGSAGVVGAGRVLLFGDEWIEFDSEWSTMPPIIQLWLNTVRWISPESASLRPCE